MGEIFKEIENLEFNNDLLGKATERLTDF